MNILAIETTGANASVAIINENGQIFQEASTETLNHLQYLIPMVGKVLEKSQLQIGDLTAIAASEGPGSFTGIRIGVSTARALAQALDISCIGVPTLETFFYNLSNNHMSNNQNNHMTGDISKNAANARRIICPIFDARRSQIYGGGYRWTDTQEKEELINGNAYTISEFLDKLSAILGDKTKNHEKNLYKEVIFFGDGVEVYKAKIEEWQNSSLNSDIQINFADKADRYQKATSVAKVALEMYKLGQICEYNDLQPNYMRKAEAERKLDEAKAKLDEAKAIEKNKKALENENKMFEA